MTDANPENPHGFWERRDVREICDRLLHAAGADWWRVTQFEPEAIPHDVLAEEGTEFAKVVSSLDEHGTWVLKEPRVCLLLSVLRDYITNPICIQIVRNPLEVARSLQVRNGFTISASIGLWEVYNRLALKASENLPRVQVSHEALVLHPAETLDELIERLAEFGVTDLERPNEYRLRQFIDPSLYRCRASEEDLPEFLSPSQLAFWQGFRSERIFKLEHSASPSRAAWQQLFDLEATQLSLHDHSERARELSGALAANSRSIAALQSRAAALTIERDELQATTSALETVIATHVTTIEARQATIRTHEKTIEACRATLQTHEASIKAQEATIQTHETTIQAREATIQAHERTIEARAAAVQSHEATIKARQATIRARDATIYDLLSSTSWRATAPLRAVSRTSRRCRRALRRAPRHLYRLGTGRFSRAINSIRLAGIKSPASAEAKRSARPIENSASVSELIRESRRRHAERTSRSIQRSPGRKALKITVIAWDLAHNPLGRAYLLADVLRHEYDVELIGATFPDFGNDIWKPLRGCNRIKIKQVPGAYFPEYFKTMEAMTEHVEGDILYVSKPRLPSLGLAVLAKMKRNRPIILDIDDHELSFFDNRKTLSLEELRAERGNLDVDVPFGEAWTRHCETLIPLVDQVTVSNEALKGKYGGIVLPHVRDGCEFDPTIYPREKIRRELGFVPEDRVILFAGTPRKHKGLSQLIAALRELDRPTYKLLVVGSPADGAVTRLLRHVDPSRATLVPDVPYSELPGYLCAADLVPLLQDEEEPVSAFQMPAKFTDALAMGIPIVASNVPPLVDAANDGLVELLGNATPAQKIDEILSNYAIYKKRSTENRESFLGKYSYASNLPKIKQVVERHTGHPKPVPDAFHDLVEYQESIYSQTGKTYKNAPKVILPSKVMNTPSVATAALAQRKTERARLRAQRSYIDDKIDVVFFWKQNDSGIYGRRQDMFVKYLARDPRVSRIFHFDAPVNLFRSVPLASKATHGGRHSHARLVARETLRRRLGFANRGKIKYDTFIHVPNRRCPGVLKHFLPGKDDYLEFLSRLFKRHELGQRRTVLWVCPVNFHLLNIDDRLQADLVVADVIDDERKWPVCEAYRDKLSRNYEEVLGLSDLVLTNCESVSQSMSALSDSIHLLPNAVELLEEEARHWPKPHELKRFSGPVIGYVGNLDIARIDLDLLRSVVSERPKWNFVFIGSMHKGDEIRELEIYGNVYFLGVRVHEQALRYIRHFDVAIIPHLDNELTRSMNPLKLYVYFSLLVPVVSTAIRNIGDFSEFVRVARSPQEFVRTIEECLCNDPLANELPRLRKLLKENSWPERVKYVLELIEREFATC
ncbi:MAG: glycosyltransferase [Rhodospirillales bacterium]|nr:glycosyltransferase [Rhodospirillales bacterium]